MDGVKTAKIKLCESVLSAQQFIKKLNGIRLDKAEWVSLLERNIHADDIEAGASIADTASAGPAEQIK